VCNITRDAQFEAGARDLNCDRHWVRDMTAVERYHIFAYLIFPAYSIENADTGTL
jgi:hypothetical protein